MLAKDRQGLVFTLRGARRVASLQPRQRQGRQRGCHLHGVALAPPQRQAVFQHLARLPVIALAAGQPGACVQTPGARHVRGLHLRQRQRFLHRSAAFGGVAAQHPEVHQRHGQLDGDERVDATGHGQRFGGTQVVHLGLEAAQPARLLAAGQSPRALFGQGEVVLAVAGRGGREFAMVLQLAAGVVANRLQHAESLAIGQRFTHQQRLLEQ